MSLRRRCDGATTSGNYGKIPISFCSATGANQGSKAGWYSLIDDQSNGPIRRHHALFYYSALCFCFSFSSSGFYSLEFCSAVCFFSVLFQCLMPDLAASHRIQRCYRSQQLCAAASERGRTVVSGCSRSTIFPNCYRI